MVTELPKEILQEAGGRLRAKNLIEQAGYTLGLAALDGTPLEDLLDDGYLPASRTVLGALEVALKDRAVSDQESKDAGGFEKDAVARSKTWRRKLASRARRASRLGRKMPEALVTIGRVGSGTAALQKQILEMTELASKVATLLPGKGVEALIAEGTALAASLGEANAAQSVAHGKALPEAVASFYQEKGRLYYALKAINDAGHELHAADPAAAAKYNLSILHRKAAKRTAPADPPVAP
jgi:hypothetical protein